MGINEKEFYRRTVWDKLLDYQKSIFVIIATIVTVTVVYLMFVEKVYTTDAVVEVSPRLNKLSNSMRLDNSQTVFARHLRTQIDFLQSRTLIEQVIVKLHANIHYYEKHGFKYQRIARDLPYTIDYIRIHDPSFYKKRFLIRAVGQDEYELRLVVDKNIFMSHKTKPLVYRFSKLLKTKYFDISISRNKDVPAKEIYFRVYEQKGYIDRVSAHLSVLQNSEQSSMIKIVYSDTNPYSAQQFVNTLIETFLGINRKQEISAAENLLHLINEKLKQAKAKLDASEDALKSYIASNKVAGLGEQTSQIIYTIFKYEKSLENLRIKAQKLKTISLLYQKGYDYRKIIALVQEVDNPNLTKFIDRITANETAYQKLRMRYKRKHPEVLKLRYIIQDQLKALLQNIEELREDTRSQIHQTQTVLKKYKAQLTTLPQKEFGYTRLKRKHDLLEKNYLFLLDKQTQVIISKQTDGAYEYRVIDYAYAPALASKPKKSVMLLLSLVLATILAFLYALLRDYFSKYIKAPSEVEELTTLPYFGTIPYIDNKKLYNDLFVIKSPNSYATEMVWSLRTMIEDTILEKREKRSDRGIVIAVCSIVKGEGKTTIAANLALSLGLGDKKTVVVGMDTRLPELHIKFGLTNQPGITSVLSGEKTLSEVTYRPKDLKNFAVIPAGKEKIYSLKMINSNKIDQILEELRKEYDYVVLDLPPVGVAAEALFLMKKSDLVINVLKAHYSEKSFVTYMESIVAKHKFENVGFVLNGVDKKYIKILTRRENVKYIKSHQYSSGVKKRRKQFDFLNFFNRK